jgi:hypothetical protein
MQWHVVNSGNVEEDTAINWYITNVVTEDAMYIEADGYKRTVVLKRQASGLSILLHA